MNTKKLLSGGTAAMLVLMALMAMVPAVSADTTKDPEVGEHGNLSRTFDGILRADWEEKEDHGGIGWFDPDDRDNNCLLRLFGLSVGTGFYYSTLRILTLQEESKFTINVQENFIPGTGCPFETADDDAMIGTTEVNIHSGVGVSQSHLLCLDTFETCTPKDETAKWTFVACKDTTLFEPGDLLGAFLAPFLSGPVQSGSSAAECDGPFNIANATAFLNDEDAQTSSIVPIDWIYADKEKPTNDHYVISCYSIEYELQGDQYTAQSHDWFLNMKDGSLLMSHLMDLSGLYDLAGDNGCPHKGDGTDIQEKPKAADLVIPGLF